LLLKKNGVWQVSTQRQLNEIKSNTDQQDRIQKLASFAEKSICEDYFGEIYPDLTDVYRSSHFMTGLSEARIQNTFTRVYDNQLDETESVDDANYALGFHILRRLKRETVASATLNSNHTVFLRNYADLADNQIPQNLSCRDKLEQTLATQYEGGYDHNLETSIEILQEAGYLSDQLAEDSESDPFYELDQFLHDTLAYLHYRELEAEKSITRVLMGFEDIVQWQKEMCQVFGALLSTTYPDKLEGQPQCVQDAAEQFKSGEREALPTLALHQKLSAYTSSVRANLTRVISKHNWMKKQFEFTTGSTEIGLAATPRINPKDDLGRIAIKELYAEVLASAILWDTYQLSLRPVFQIFPFRIRDIPEAYRDTSETLKRIERNQENNVYSDRLMWGFKQLDGHYDVLMVNRFKDLDLKTKYDDYAPGTSIDYVNIIALTKAKDLYDNNESLRNSGNLKRTWRRLRHKGLMVSLKTATAASKAFGNSMGMIHSGRDGHMRSIATNPEKLAALKAQLRPLDILLEKSRFLATDKTIPGHYGHVAVWMGSPEQLKASGISDDRLESLFIKAKIGYGYMANFPAAQQVSFKQSIEQGHAVLEALRSGVQLNSLEHFLNIDDLAVLRFNFCDETFTGNCITKDQIVTYLSEGFKQVGKKYDFAFDTETEREIVCSELVFRMFVDKTWPTSSSIGPMNAISPDQVAIKADWLKGRPTLTSFVDVTEAAFPIILYNFNTKTGRLDEPMIDNDYQPGKPKEVILNKYRSLIHKNYQAFEDAQSAAGVQL
jgi:hypothetical protein